jgi:hypothetical protein
VPPRQIEGLDTITEEDFGPGRVTFASLPIVPGAEAFTDEIQVVVDADIERFKADTDPVVWVQVPNGATATPMVAGIQKGLPYCSRVLRVCGRPKGPSPRRRAER